MGYELADAQNIAVRVFLKKFSAKFKFFDQDYLQKTLEYFDYKCPYTGEDLTKVKYVKDHVIPFNRQSCGLHVFGNVLLVTREANSEKGAKTLEEYLKNEPERLEKIKKFVKDSGYQDIHDKYCSLLQSECEELYNDTGKLIKEKYDEFENFFGKEISSASQSQKEEEIIGSLNKIIKIRQTSISKEEIKSICEKNGLKLPNEFNKGKKNSTQNIYWLNPDISAIKSDWFVVLDDNINHTLHCFEIPANSICISNLKVRKDKPSQIDLQICYNDLSYRDRRSGIEFAKWLVKTIDY